MHEFFTQGNRQMYGARFGYAIEYSISEGIVQFDAKMVLPSGRDTTYVSKLKLVSECIHKLCISHKNVKVILEAFKCELYFSEGDELWKIQKTIENIVLETVSPDIKGDVRWQMQKILQDNISRIDIY